MRRLNLATLLLVLATLAACSKEPSAPTPGTYSLSGRVRLIGYLVHPDGRFAGNRVVEDADGVRVQLLFGNQVVATTLTTDGVYRFSGLASGGYVARAVVFDLYSATTDLLTIPEQDVVARDTLRLTAFGALLPAPNPMAPNTVVYFDVADSSDADLRVLDVSGAQVRTLFSRFDSPGSFAIPWNGRDDFGVEAPPGLYWLIYVQGDDVRVHLLFK